MKLTPLFDRVIVRTIENPKTTPGGLYIPDISKEKPTIGQVISCGEGKPDSTILRTPRVKAGNKILFGKYSGVDVELDNEKYLIIREDDILAIIED